MENMRTDVQMQRVKGRPWDIIVIIIVILLSLVNYFHVV